MLSYFLVCAAAFGLALIILWRRAYITDRRGLVRVNLDSGRRSRPDTMKVSGGELVCPDCGHKGTILRGPSGGMAQNCACDDCLSEFNIIIPDNLPIIVDRMGKLSVQRAQIYGISPEEWKEKTDENPLDAVRR